MLPASRSTRKSSGCSKWPQNVTVDGSDAFQGSRYLLHDRDEKHFAAFCPIIETARVQTLALPARRSTPRHRGWAHPPPGTVGVLSELLGPGTGFRDAHRFIVFRRAGIS